MIQTLSILILAFGLVYSLLKINSLERKLNNIDMKIYFLVTSSLADNLTKKLKEEGLSQEETEELERVHKRLQEINKRL